MVSKVFQQLKRSVFQASKTRIGGYVVRKVNKKKEPYQLHYPNDLDGLKRTLLPGDVLLVEGDFGISEWIKVFSTHTWSHCALYVGDRSRVAQTTPKEFTDPGPNLVEALIGRGVILTSLAKYQNCNLRICRPKNLTWKQKEKVIRFALQKVGSLYDQENILQFVTLPFDETARPTDDIGEKGRYTCSSLIGAAFTEVGLEVLHFYDKKARKLVPYHNSQLQPKDFDLSPNFEIIKLHPVTHRKPDSFLRALFLKRKSA